MGYQSPFPQQMQQIEYVKLYFHLEICHYFDLPPLGLLQLRRELLRALKSLPANTNMAYVEQLRQLLQPDLPSDPILLRQIQKPSPALVITPDISERGLFEPKQKIVLPVLFIGSGIMAVDSFVCLLRHLGELGLSHGSGQFVVEGVESEDGSGRRAMLWFGREPTVQLNPPVCNLSWWLERQPPVGDAVQFEIISPLRLIHRNKPLFRAEFNKVFPFLFRRVTGLLAGYSNVDLSLDPTRYISLADQVESSGTFLKWQDWRVLEKPSGDQSLGGLMGTFELRGDTLTELLWVLQLGSLFNFGKSASYGAGQYRLIYS